MTRVLFFILLLIFFSPSAEAMSSYCPDSEVMITTKKSAESVSVCDAVRIGDAFLKTFGLKISPGLAITLYDDLPGIGQQHSIGYYDSRSNEIRLLNYAAVLSASEISPPSFGVRPNRAIWHSYIIHELAHAAAQKRFAPGVPIWTASEYIAAVVQLATLPPSELDKIFRNYDDVTGFDKKEEITLAFYLLDPSRFSVNAYLHYLKPENGLRFVNRLLSEGLPDD